MVIHIFIIIWSNHPSIANHRRNPFLTLIMGSSQSAPVQQVVYTIELFGYHPATVFKFFIVIGIITGVTIIALAILRHKKALDVSAQLRAAKVLRKATHQDAYIEYAQTRSPPPTTTMLPPPPPPPPPLFASVNENVGTKGFLPTHYPSALHNNNLVSPVQTYSNQPIPIHNGNNGLVFQSHSVNPAVTQ